MLVNTEQQARRFQQLAAAVVDQVSNVIIGQREVIRDTVVCLISGRNVLIEGVPGLGKTELVRTLARVLDLQFSRIQFTPDLMPSDITGTNVLMDGEKGRRIFRFEPGPIFSNLILADEINRATPKTQSALLEAMQEHQVSVAREVHRLEPPFFVVATQNPIEMEGTYPLPEAQLDRFMFMIKVDYPSPEEEIDIMKMATGEAPETPKSVLNAQQILDLQAIVRKMPVSDHVFEYARQLVRVTRVTTDEALPLCKKWLSWGAGPRAGLNLIMAAKAMAMIEGNVYVGTENVAAMAGPVLRHRIIPNFSATSEGLTADDIIDRIVEQVPQKEKLS